MGDTISNNRDIDCGIPQGSILGHKLFLAYVDMCNISEILKFTLCADDLNIFYSNIDISHKQVISELNKLHALFNISKLSLNVSMTNPEKIIDF